MIQCTFLALALPYCYFLFFHSNYQQSLRSSANDRRYESTKQKWNDIANSPNIDVPRLSSDVSKPEKSAINELSPPSVNSNDGSQAHPETNEESKNYPSAFSESFLRHLESLPPLPKVVHILFPDKEYWENAKHLGFVQKSILNLKKLNPDWEVIVHDDSDVDNVIREGAKKGLISQEECDLLVGKPNSGGNDTTPVESAHIVERSDIARLLLMYINGGFYLDADRLIGKKMSDVLFPNTKLCLPTYNDVNFCQDIMCSPPGNELFLSMIQGASERRMTGGPNGEPLPRKGGWVEGGKLYGLGPDLYNMEIFGKLFLGMKKKDYRKYVDNKEFFKARREDIGELNGLIVTGIEVDCNSGLLVDESIGNCDDRSELYDLYGMKSWAKTVDARWAEE